MAKQRKRKKKKKLARILFVEFIILLLLIGAANIYNTLNKIQHDDSKDKEIVQNEIEEKEGFRNIVIFGVDSRENFLEKGTHTDTIIVATINNKTKDVKLASIYRDTYVNIPEKGYDKINAAYFKDGYSLALSTINTNFDLNVKEYVTVNFKAVVDVIDRLGGITLDITDEELKWLNGYVRELNRINGTSVPGLTSAGTQTVNGTQATAYARIRYTAGGDYKRTERQRIVISKIFGKVKSSDLETITALINEMFPQIYTNLSSLEILSLAKDVFSYNIVDQTGFPFEKDAHTYKKVSYVFPINLQDNVIRLHEFLFDEIEYVPSQTVQEYSNYIESIRVQ